MVNIVKDLSVEHILMFVIVAFLLYHLIGGCSCSMLRMLRMPSRDGFSVGGKGFPVPCDYFNNNEEGCTNKNDYFKKRYPTCTPECLANPYQKGCTSCLWNPTCRWDSRSNTCFGPPPKNDYCNIKEYPGAVCHDDIDCVGDRTCGNPDAPDPVAAAAVCYGERNCPKI
jgi:hypothetical protein